MAYATCEIPTIWRMSLVRSLLYGLRRLSNHYYLAYVACESYNVAYVACEIPILWPTSPVKSLLYGLRPLCNPYYLAFVACESYNAAYVAYETTLCGLRRL